MTDITDQERKPLPSLMPALYSHRLVDIQQICYECGYAVAVHGSMQRDLDLIAVPWVENAESTITLIDRLCGELNLDRLPGDPEVRPYNRLTWTLMMGGSCFMDLSVIGLEGS